MHHFLWLLLFSFALAAETFYPFSKVHKGEESQYLFLKDTHGDEWVFKQYKDPNCEDYVDLVYEALAAQIATDLHIPINEARFIRAASDFTPKIKENEPGSLHLKVPGAALTHQLPWEGFTLQQKYRTPWIEKKKGALPEAEKGLSLEVIKTLAKHSDLAKIAALDTYLGNMDRSLNNLFYDKATNHFYGTDMGNSFKGNLAALAFQKVCQYNEENKLTDQDIEGLSIYKETLERLVKKYPAQRCAQLLDDMIEEYHLTPYQSNPEFRRKLVRTRRIMRKSYESSMELIKALNHLNSEKI